MLYEVITLILRIHNKGWQPALDLPDHCLDF